MLWILHFVLLGVVFLLPILAAFTIEAVDASEEISITRHRHSAIDAAGFMHVAFGETHLY